MKLDVTAIMASELDVAFLNVSCYSHGDFFSTCRQIRTLFYLAASFKQSHSSTLVSRYSIRSCGHTISQHTTIRKERHALWNGPFKCVFLRA